MPDAQDCLVGYLQGLDAERSVAQATQAILQGMESEVAAWSSLGSAR
jgi:hypothetical protein